MSSLASLCVGDARAVEALSLRPEIGLPLQGGVHTLRWLDSAGETVAAHRFGSTEMDAFMDVLINEGWFHEWFETQVTRRGPFPSWIEEMVQLCADEGLIGEPLFEDDDEDEETSVSNETDGAQT